MECIEELMDALGNQREQDQGGLPVRDNLFEIEAKKFRTVNGDVDWAEISEAAFDGVAQDIKSHIFFKKAFSDKWKTAYHVCVLKDAPEWVWRKLPKITNTSEKK